MDVLFYSINVGSKQLYAAVEYPVPVGTPLISPLIQWDHSQSWDVPKVEDFPAGSGGSTSATVYNIGKQILCVTNIFIISTDSLNR